MGSLCKYHLCNYNSSGRCEAGNSAIVYDFAKVKELYDVCEDVPTKLKIQLLLLDDCELFAQSQSDHDIFFANYFAGRNQRSDIDDVEITKNRLALIDYVVTNFANVIISNTSDLAFLFN